jgi:uncharacterized membrane protein
VSKKTAGGAAQLAAGLMQWLAAAEVALAVGFFVAALSYARLTAPSRLKATTTAAD